MTLTNVQQKVAVEVYQTILEERPEASDGGNMSNRIGEGTRDYY